MTDAAAASELPIFSKRLDELMASMLKGEAPNVGRFCGYCYTPLGKTAAVCPHCARAAAEYAPVARIPAEFFALYQRMRRRESIIVNSFAFAGLGLGLVLFIVMVAVAVYRFNASLWWMAGATALLIVGGRVFAGILGGWIGDSIGYEVAHRKLAVEWQAYEREREARLHPPSAHERSESGAAPAGHA
ncbi:MAG: hypothetical protein ACYDEB_01250 [Dehalococcoidia bacterium]